MLFIVGSGPRVSSEECQIKTGLDTRRLAAYCHTAEQSLDPHVRGGSQTGCNVAEGMSREEDEQL